MKKILFLLVSILLINPVSAGMSLKCAGDNPPALYCGIHGKETNSCFASDTSSWAIPKAYDGECNSTPELTENQKNQVHKIMVNFLDKKGYLAEKGNGYVLTGNSFYGESGTGIDFVKNKFFPAVVSYIENENNKSNPNTKMIAILNEAVSIIQYDWYIEKK